MTAQFPPVTPTEAPDHWMADLSRLPWSSLQLFGAFGVGMCDLWARMVMGWMFAPHPPEARFQLEIPDPLADDPEQELFA